MPVNGPNEGVSAICVKATGNSEWQPRVWISIATFHEIHMCNISPNALAMTNHDVSMKMGHYMRNSWAVSK